MAKVGYIRVSTIRQNTGRQEVAMPEDVRKVFIDHQSGKDTDRPSLKACFAFLREGDTLIVESISRFARNTRDLLTLVAKLQEMDVAFVSLKENIDTQTAQGALHADHLRRLRGIGARADIGAAGGGHSACQGAGQIQRPRAGEVRHGRAQGCMQGMARRKGHGGGGHAQDGTEARHLLSAREGIWTIIKLLLNKY